MKLEVLQHILRLYFGWLTRHPLWVTGFYLPLFVFSLFLIVTRLGINTDLSDMISDRLEFHQDWIHYKEDFPHLNDTVLVVVESEDPAQAILAARKFSEDISAKTELVEQVHWLNDPLQFGSKSMLYAEGEDFERIEQSLPQWNQLLGAYAFSPDEASAVFGFLAPLVARDPSSEFSQELRRALHSEVDRLDYAYLFLDEAQMEKRQFIEIKPKLNFNLLLPAEEIVLELRKMARTFESSELQIGITGPAALGFEELQSVSEGALLSALLTLILVSLILYWTLQSGRLIAVTLFNLIVGLIFTAALAAAMVGNLNMISVAFAVLFIGLGVDYSIHICLRYRELIQSGSRPNEAVVIAFSHIGTGIFICTLTTAAGFFAFVPTAYAGVSELGLISGVGMFVNLFVHLSLLPSLLMLLPKDRFSELRGSQSSLGGSLAQLCHSRSRVVLGLLAIVFLAGLGLSFYAEFDPNPMNLQNPNTEAYQTYRKLLKNPEQSPWTIKLVKNSAEEVEASREALSKIPEVHQVISLSSLAPNITEEKRVAFSKIELPKSYRRNSAAVSKDQFEQAKARFIQQLRAASTVNSESDIEAMIEAVQSFEQGDFNAALSRPTRDFYVEMASFPEIVQKEPIDLLPPKLARRYLEDGKYRIEVFPKADLMNIDEMRKFSDAVLQVEPNATDDPVSLPKSGDAVVEAFVQASVGAALIIFILLMLMTKSALDSALVMSPLVLASVATAGLVTAIGIDFNFANIIVLPLLLGIGVDSGVHLMHRIRSENIKEAFQGTTARGIFFSALTTVASFGTLSLSAHRGTASMGVLLTLGTLIVMLSTLSLMPALLKREQKQKPKIEVEEFKRAG